MGKVHHLDVGCGDASIIVTNSATFLVDCYNIGDSSSLLPQNKKLRGVFITHQHRDHFSGLQFLKDNNYTIDCLIICPYNRRHNDHSIEYDEWNEFNTLKDYFVQKGTKLYTPYRQASFDKPFWETNGAKFHIIGPHSSIADSDTRELHDASLVIKVNLGSKYCLFTGDASDANLEYIANNTTKYCEDILHASHHGSINGAHLEFIKGCNANETIISTKSGVHESVPHSTALQRYKAHTKNTVFRTDTSGSLSWEF